ncbi:MAG: hypothetical protein GXY43_06960 [Clostridiaceae bacterium]|nr:hypothetical protein [Clostridiaceae bacterium]
MAFMGIFIMGLVMMLIALLIYMVILAAGATLLTTGIVFLIGTRFEKTSVVRLFGYGIFLPSPVSRACVFR